MAGATGASTGQDVGEQQLQRLGSDRVGRHELVRRVNPQSAIQDVEQRRRVDDVAGQLDVVGVGVGVFEAGGVAFGVREGVELGVGEGEGLRVLLTVGVAVARRVARGAVVRVAVTVGTGGAAELAAGVGVVTLVEGVGVGTVAVGPGVPRFSSALPRTIPATTDTPATTAKMIQRRSPESTRT